MFVKLKAAIGLLPAQLITKIIQGYTQVRQIISSLLFMFANALQKTIFAFQLCFCRCQTVFDVLKASLNCVRNLVSTISLSKNFFHFVFL